MPPLTALKKVRSEYLPPSIEKDLKYFFATVPLVSEVPVQVHPVHHVPRGEAALGRVRPPLGLHVAVLAPEAVLALHVLETPTGIKKPLF